MTDIDAKLRPLTAVARDEDTRATQTGSRISWLQWGVMLVLLLMVAEFGIRHVNDIPERKDIFFRVIVPLEIVVIMLLAMGVRRLLEPISPPVERLLRFA